MQKLRLLFVFSLLILASCRQTGNKKPGSSIDTASPSELTAPSIHRYEVALFSLDQKNFAADLNKIAPEFRVFLGNNYQSPEAIEQLRAFVNDPQNSRTYQDCMKQYPDLDWLSEGLSKAFKIYSKEIPNAVIPKVYTYVSGFDFQYPIKYADSAMIISLDIYLGSGYKDYQTMGIPVYVSQRLTRDHILPDCVKELCYPLMEKSKSQTLLDAMIEEGKILYFCDVLLPEEAKEFKIGFTPAQLKWCEENESNLWSFLIENELLYSTNAESMSMFMTDGPFTSAFSQESPARTGAWLGWQIVSRYADKTGTSLTALLKNTNSQEILAKSGYKPRRK